MNARRRPQGWPLILLFVGYPVWWLVGITLPMTMIAVGMLIAELNRMRPLRLPRFGTLWMLFMAWAAIGVLVVEVDAPLAVGGWNTNRYLTWLLRLFWYLAATVLLVYLGNIDRATRSRIYVAFGWMFVWIVIGGYLGSLDPRADFPSVLEVLLPRSLSSNLFVASIVHPNLAEQMEFAGVTRPSAPFPFANVWGLNFACFLPFFVIGWGRAASLRKRRMMPVVLVLSIVPVVESLNRGLWAALAVAVLVIALRALAAGDVRLIVGIVVAMLLLGALIGLTPLRSTVASRFNSPNSNDGRSALASRGFESTLGSPIVGFGTTRAVQGSLTSIAGGSTPGCPRCGAPSYGTQGQIFLITFCQGYVGAAFYLVFLLLVCVRSMRRRGHEVTMGLCVMAMHGVTLFVYSADNLAVVPIFAAAGVLWRAADEGWAGVPLMFTLARSHPRRVAGAVILGGMVGMAVYVGLPHQVQVDTPVLIGSGDTSAAAEPVTLDTIASLTSDASVVSAIAKAVHADPATVSRHLSVTAEPNTRVLDLTYTARSAATARAGSEAAATALLARWSREFAASEAGDQRELAGQLDGIVNAIDVVRTGRLALQQRTWGAVGQSAARQLAGLDNDLVSNWEGTDRALRLARASEPTAGSLIGRPMRLTTRLPWSQRVAEGAALGLLLPLAVAARPSRRRRRRTNSSRSETEVAS